MVISHVGCTVDPFWSGLSEMVPWSNRDNPTNPATEAEMAVFLRYLLRLDIAKSASYLAFQAWKLSVDVFDEAIWYTRVPPPTSFNVLLEWYEENCNLIKECLHYVMLHAWCLLVYFCNNNRTITLTLVSFFRFTLVFFKEALYTRSES